MIVHILKKRPWAAR